MPRYLVERTFSEGLALPTPTDGEHPCQALIDNNRLEGVTWVHSYVTADRRRSYCICEAPNAEAVRRAAVRNGWPADRITQVHGLDPYFST
jgi:hypothetical protein